MVALFVKRNVHDFFSFSLSKIKLSHTSQLTIGTIFLNGWICVTPLLLLTSEQIGKQIRKAVTAVYISISRSLYAGVRK